MIPDLYRVRQIAAQPVVADIAATVRQQWLNSPLAKRIKPGAKIAFHHDGNFVDDVSGYTATPSEAVTARLPTEAEWELACRAGTSTEYWWGDQPSTSDDVLGTRAPSLVGSGRPNPLGLFNMHGNVREWCQDWYSPDYYAHSPQVNPRGPDSGTERIWRGGSWGPYADYCRTTTRVRCKPGAYSIYAGFRPARNE